MSLSKTSLDKSIGPEELAIVGLMEAIFQLADNGALFINRLDKSRSRTAISAVFPGLNALVPVKEKVTWLVGVIKRHVEKETIQHANAESRQSVSSIIKICTFQLNYLSNQIFVATGSPLSQKRALISLLGRNKEILERVNFIDVQVKDLTRLLDYLNNIRPSPRPGPSISNPPTSLVPRVPCNDFVGRDRMLEALQRKMNTTGQMALDGPPGIGKSEICLQYARKLQDKALMKWIFWIDGKDPTESFATIVRYLGLNLSSQDSPASAVLQWIMKSKDESLIIVDDVNDIDSNEQSYYTPKRLIETLNDSKTLVPVPTSASSLSLKSLNLQGTKGKSSQNQRANLLISSKALIAQNKTMEKINLPVERVPSLNDSEAIKLLKELIPKSSLSSESDYTDIIKIIGRLPGALKQAAKYIEDTGIMTAQYISGCKKDKISQTGNCQTLTSSDDDVQIAAMRISKTFSQDEMFKSVLNILHCANVRNDKIIKTVETQLLEYSSDLERVCSERAAQGNEPENSLPAFIKEHHKRLACLLVPRDSVEQTDYFSFAPRRLSSITSPEPGVSRRSSLSPRGLSLRGLSGRVSRQDSIAEEEKQMLASRVTLTETVRIETTDQSKKLERFYFDEAIFGRFLINLLRELETLHQTEEKRPLFCEAEHISKLAPLVTKAWSSSHQTATITYNVEWELPEVLDRDFAPDQHLSKYLVISGRADWAEAITCGEYVSKFWKHGTCLLDKLSGTECQWGRFAKATSNDGIEILIPKTEPRSERSHSIQLIVEASDEVQSDIAQTLVWLAAAVRSSNFTSLHESRASIGFSLDDGAINCTIKSLPLTPLINFCKESSCWHALFTNSVVAIDYPQSKPRSSESVRGLSISFETLRALARTTIITEDYKGFIIRGYQFSLVPVENLTARKAESPYPDTTVQWHLLVNNPSSEVTAASLYRLDDKTRLRSVAKNIETLRRFIVPGSHAFLGWCGKVNINVGTDTRNSQNGNVNHQAQAIDEPGGYASPYRDPRLRLLTSDARDAGRAKSISMISATVGGGGYGATGGTAAAVMIGESREVAVVGRIGPLKETLQTRSKENIVLYDTATRRAWVVPYLNVLLHLVHLRELSINLNRERTIVKMPFAAQISSSSDGPAWDAIQPYLDLLDTENFNKHRLNRLNNHLSEKELQFKNALKLVDHLEYLVAMIDTAFKQNVAWRSKEMSLFHNSKIYGFEMEELSYAASLGYKEQKLHYTSGGWAKMRRNRGQVFFCSGIGDLITPFITPESDWRLCSRCQSVPMGMAYLVAPVSCLSTCQHSRHTNGDDEPSHFKIQIKNSRLSEWKVSEAHFSEPCPHYHSDDSECAKHQKTIRLSKSPQTSNLEDFSNYMEGAVIFGRQARYGAFKSHGSSIRKWMSVLTKKGNTQEREPIITTPRPTEGSSRDKPLRRDRSLEMAAKPLGLGNSAAQYNEVDNSTSGEPHSRVFTSDSSCLTQNLFREEPPSIPAVPSQPESKHLASSRTARQHKLTISTSSKLSSYEHTQVTTLSPSTGNNDTSRGTTPEQSSPSDAFKSVLKPDVEGD